MLFLAVSVYLLPGEPNSGTPSLGLPHCTMGYVDETLRVGGFMTLELGWVGCGHPRAQLMQADAPTAVCAGPALLEVGTAAEAHGSVLLGGLCNLCGLHPSV